MKFEDKLRILENANELINSIARDSLAEGERLSERGDEPTARCKLPVDAGLTLRKVNY
ncbi:MAG: hypothetical protein IPL26_01345 [Leptospiraceae bacterium]|nr:hypothetical protein [Leptospiraceae bacterium]